MKTIAMAGAAMLLASSTAAHADEVCPTNNFAVVRTSQIKPTGSLEGFRKAMADHAKWYADHGFTADKFAWGQVVEYDRAAKAMKPAAGKVMTFHWASSRVPDAQQDAAWKAYVAEYEANSTIVSTAIVCMGE